MKCLLTPSFFVRHAATTAARMHECCVVVAWRGNVMILNAALFFNYL
jgi:hypothetical protein